jgi:hypothetical protein
MPDRINLGLLSRAELELIRAKIAAGDFDDLDAGALLDHIDAREAEYEALVQRSNGQDAAIRRNQRIVDLVTAKNSVVKPSTLNPGRVVVLDGRTGCDASEETADECFDVLFAEYDGEGSPGRIQLTISAPAEGVTE